MFRQVVLTLSAQPLVKAVVERYGMRLGAARFVAGETLDEAVAVARDLKRRGLLVTLDHVGENVATAEAAQAARDSYLAMLDALHAAGLDANVSLKLTMMGAAFDRALAAAHTRSVVEKAAQLGGFVRIDMEDHPYTDFTLEVFRALWDAFPGHVGVVLQAYLYRSRQDLQALSDRPRNFRIVKGAYQEPARLAFPAKADVDDNYVRLVEESLTAGHYTAIATHDELIIGRILRWIRREHIPRDRYEFQMLYGVKQSVLEELAREGYRCRVYVPYGRDWYGYFTRRLAERPANLLFFAEALLRR